jgi:NADPH2:quinone reductase
MRALVVRRPGGPDAMKLEDLPEPVLHAHEVLVAVEAVGVNPVDATNRADPTWAAISPPYIVGYEFAGSIARVGADVTELAKGEQVWGLLPVRRTHLGAYAELVAVNAAFVRPRPQALGPLEAASLPVAGSTSLQLLDRLGLQAGDWVLVHGAAGGVGSVFVQLARALGLQVAACASKPRHPLLRDLGVEVIVDRDAPNALAATVQAVGSPPRAVVDLVGKGLLNDSLPFVAEYGVAASIVELTGDLEEAIDRNITIHGVLLRPDGSDLERLAAEVGRGRLRAVIDEVVELERAHVAHRRVESGHGQGKVVLQVERRRPAGGGVSCSACGPGTLTRPAVSPWLQRCDW